DVLHYVRRLEAAGAAKRGRVDIYDLARACGAPGPRKRPAGLPAGHGAAVRWFTGALSVRYTSAAPPVPPTSDRRRPSPGCQWRHIVRPPGRARTSPGTRPDSSPRARPGCRPALGPLAALGRRMP